MKKKKEHRSKMARAGHKENMSKAHRMSESKGMKKAMHKEGHMDMMAHRRMGK